MDLEEYRINLENAEPYTRYYPEKWQHFSNDWHTVLKIEEYGGFKIGDQVTRRDYGSEVYQIQYFIELSKPWYSIPTGTICVAFEFCGFLQLHNVLPLAKP